MAIADQMKTFLWLSVPFSSYFADVSYELTASIFGVKELV
jgi:hypothetical protein